MQVRKRACGFFTIASSTEETVKAGKRVITIPSKCTEAHVPTPRYGQYLTHAHNHITQAVAAMDSCFALIGAHQHGIAVGPMNGEIPRVWKTLYCAPRRVQSTPWSKQVIAVGTCASVQLLGIVSKDKWYIRSGRARPFEENWLSSERNKNRTQTAVINIVNFCVFIETWGLVCRVKIHFQKCQKWLIQVVLKSSRSLES